MMPRTYIRKRIKQYTPQKLAEAIEMVKKGELTQYGAAQKYKIPLTTLHDHLNKPMMSNSGRPTAIPLEEEKKLANAIIIMEKWGFGLSRFEIMELVAEYVRVNNIQTPFKNNVPGPDWFINFRKRHRLSIKKAQSLEFMRRKMTDPFVIANYFNLLKNTLTELNLFDKPENIWNLDETSLCLDPSRTKVVGQINKSCSRITYGSGKENITVLAVVSASGKKLPPLIVFKGKFVWDQWMAEQDGGGYDFNLSYAASTKGWMETDIFYNYIEKVLIPNLGEKRPVLIIYDGHSTHVDVRVVELVIQNNITILKLPPHTSHLLQPLDLAVLKSFKTLWDAKLVEWQRKNVGLKMPKKTFSQTLADTWQQTKAGVIKSGFRKAGIFPFNANVIHVDQYDPDVYKRFQKSLSDTHFHMQSNRRNLKSLKEISLVYINNQLVTGNDSIRVPNSDNVTLLSRISKSDIETLRFLAKEPTQLPSCLLNPKPTQSQPQTLSKINIISNVIIKNAPQSPLQTQPLSQLSCTFEDLLVRKIQQDKKDTSSTKKKRVAKGAEVITATVGTKILKQIKEIKNVKTKSKSTKNNKNQPAIIDDNTSNTKCASHKQEEFAGPSGIKTKKRKREPSCDSITSVSDYIMGLYSDSDIFGCKNFNDLTDNYNEDDDKIYNETENYTDRENESELNKRDFNILKVHKKNKGVGKKSTGKGNRADKKEEKENRDVNCKNVSKKAKVMIIKEDYKLYDSVLVRYYVRQKWRYYIGFVTGIKKQEKTLFSINFLKTMRRQQQLTFVMPKRQDSDEVPESLIVKRIDVQKKSITEKEYYLSNYEDAIYFID